MSTLSTSWYGSIESGLFENGDGFYLQIIDNDWKLGHYDLEDEDIEFLLSLKDLLANPVFRVAFLDPLTGKLYADMIPNIVIGNTVKVKTIQDMLSLTDEQVQVGDICVVTDIPGGVSFRLALPDISDLQSWTELVSRFANWKDIQGKPTFSPAYAPGEKLVIPSIKHNHDTRYPLLDNEGMLPSKYLRSIPVGNRFIVDTFFKMVQLAAVKGDVCFVRGLIKRRYQLYGLASNLVDWTELDDAENGVYSVNGLSGHVLLEAVDIGALPDTTSPDDIGAADIEHDHDDEYSSIDHNHDNAYSDVNHEHNSINTIEGDPIQVSFDDTGLSVALDENNVFEIAEKNHTHDNLSDSNHEHNAIKSLEGNDLQFALDSEDLTIVIDQVNGFVIADKNQIFDETGNFKVDKIQTVENENIRFQWDGTDLKFSIDGGVYRPFA